jgi:hypothetical protein
MTVLFSNNATTTLAAGISSTSTTVNLASGSGIEFPAPVHSGDYFIATFYSAANPGVSEIVHCTAITGDVVTIVRGQESTAHLAWQAGDYFVNNLTAGILNNFEQTGAPPASPTTIVYVGVDKSSTVNTIICSTNPVPATLLPGMQFNILIANTNTGPVTAQLNGGVTLTVTNDDGSAMTGGELTIGQEMIFVYNGTILMALYPTTITKTNPGPNPPPAPPQPRPICVIFYVDWDIGDDRCDGKTNYHFGDSSLFHGPCKTIMGIIGKFTPLPSDNYGHTYIPVIYGPCAEVWIYVAVGYPTFPGGPNTGYSLGGCYDSGNSVGLWHIIGSGGPNLPSIIQATDIDGVYTPPYCLKTQCCNATGRAKFDLQNIQFISADINVVCGSSPQAPTPIPGAGIVYASNCHWTTPMTCNTGGTIHLFGNHHFNCKRGGPGDGIFGCHGGQIHCGEGPVSWSAPAVFTLDPNSYAGSAYFQCKGNGLINCAAGAVTFNGPIPASAPYQADTGGGISLNGATPPGSLPVIVNSPGWVSR